MVSSCQGFLEGSWFGDRHPLFQSSFSQAASGDAGITGSVGM